MYKRQISCEQEKKAHGNTTNDVRSQCNVRVAHQRPKENDWTVTTRQREGHLLWLVVGREVAERTRNSS